MSQYGSSEKIDGRKASLGLAFGEIGNAFLIPGITDLGMEKGSNYDLAKVKTGFGINSSKCNEIPGLEVTPRLMSRAPLRSSQTAPRRF